MSTVERSHPSRAFDDLYEATRHRLALQMYALTGDRQMALDLVQEAFTRCWTRWERISSYDDPEAYVRRIAYNLAKSDWRRRRRLGRRPPPRASAHVDADGGDRHDLVVALGRLSVEQRTAVTLHHLAGLTVEETAAQMDAPVGTVKSWLARGRDHLADHLSPTSQEELPS
jgi:RNA polymerase sigma-70 factor (ECF subfamily)